MVWSWRSNGVGSQFQMEKTEVSDHIFWEETDESHKVRVGNNSEIIWRESTPFGRELSTHSVNTKISVNHPTAK